MTPDSTSLFSRVLSILKRRCALQDDFGESAPCHGCHGAKGNESSRLVQRIEYYPANALPACCAGRQATEGRAESHRSRTDTASARKETVNAMAYPGFPSNCYSDPISNDVLHHLIQRSLSNQQLRPRCGGFESD